MPLSHGTSRVKQRRISTRTRGGSLRATPPARVPPHKPSRQGTTPASAPVVDTGGAVCDGPVTADAFTAIYPLDYELYARFACPECSLPLCTCYGGEQEHDAHEVCAATQR